MRFVIIGIFFFILKLPLLAQMDSLYLLYKIDQHALQEPEKKKLDKFIHDLDPTRSYKLSLTGSADYLGNESYNKRLSDRRVRIVKAYLEKYYGNLIDGFAIHSLGEINNEGRYDPGGGVQMHRVVKLVVNDGNREVTLEKEIEKAGTGEKIVLKNLNFHGGRHFLLRESVPELKRLLRILKDHPGMKIEIQGHVCCVDPTSQPDGMDIDTRTFDLSVNRAKNIYEYLVKNGIDSTRLSYLGFGGSQKLVLPEDTEKARTMNRRVEIMILEK